MEALSEPDHVSVPDSTRSPSDPSVVATSSRSYYRSVGTGSDGCDACPLPPAADPLSSPAAADLPEISAAEIDPSVALGRSLARMILVSDPQACLDPLVAPSSVDLQLLTRSMPP